MSKTKLSRAPWSALLFAALLVAVAVVTSVAWQQASAGHAGEAYELRLSFVGRVFTAWGQ